MKKKQVLLLFLLVTLRTPVYAHSNINNKTKQQDFRCKFFDLSRVIKNRKSRSPIIQFYSSTDNIGNYLPILGIQKMLGCIPDTWCMHRRADFNFINKHYK